MEDNTKNPENSGSEEIAAEVASETVTKTVAKPETNTDKLVEPKMPYEKVPIELRSLIEAGAHFGHKTEKWNPKMAQYIFGEKNGVHIINLDRTLELWGNARKYIVDVTSRGGTILFVGTKQQASGLVAEAAKRCDSPFVNKRWLGGTLSNFETIKNSIRRMNKLEELHKKSEGVDAEYKIGKKERLLISKDLAKLDNNLGGIRHMKKIPDVIFIFDIKKESIAVKESNKLHIPVIALVDTNVNPAPVSYPIPSNDDAFKAIKLFANGVADAVLEGKMQHKVNKSKIEKERQDKRNKAKAKKEAELGAAEAAAASSASA